VPRQSLSVREASFVLGLPEQRVRRLADAAVLPDRYTSARRRHVTARGLRDYIQEQADPYRELRHLVLSALLTGRLRSAELPRPDTRYGAPPSITSVLPLLGQRVDQTS
jgi:hypothetical protein